MRVSFYIQTLKESIMKQSKPFDTVVIGAGPSGIFTAIKLAGNGLRVAIVDQGGNYYSRKSVSGRDLNGFGGAALRYDANLDYYCGIPESSNLGERVFGGKSEANRQIAEVYTLLESFGFREHSIPKTKGAKKQLEANSDLQIIDRGIVPIGEKLSTNILKNIYADLISKGVKFFEFTEATQIAKENEIFNITVVSGGKKKSSISAKTVVLAAGKLSIFKARKIFDELGINYTPCESIDIGVRIETDKAGTDRITNECINPKIILDEGGDVIRTFCWCPGGKVISYLFEGAYIMDGQHCHDLPTQQTNFGIVSTIRLPKGVDGTNFGLSYIKMFNEFTNFKPALQILDDFIAKRVTDKAIIQRNDVIPTIQDYSLIDINTILPFDLRTKILRLIEKINNAYPQSIPRNSLLYGPVLERIFPRVNIDSNMGSSVKGFYVVGDISGKAMGVVTGAAMGIKAAKNIIRNFR